MAVHTKLSSFNESLPVSSFLLGLMTGNIATAFILLFCIFAISSSKALSPYLLIPGKESIFSTPSKSSFTNIGCIKSFTDRLFSATKLLMDEVNLVRLNLD